MPEIEKNDDEAHLDNPENPPAEIPATVTKSEVSEEETQTEATEVPAAQATPEASETAPETSEETETPEPETETPTADEAAPEVAEAPVARPRRGRRGRGFSGAKAAAAQSDDAPAGALSEVTIEAGISDALSERVAKIKATGPVESTDRSERGERRERGDRPARGERRDRRDSPRGEQGDGERRERRPRRSRERRKDGEAPEEKSAAESRFADSDEKKDRKIEDRFVKRSSEDSAPREPRGRSSRNTPVKMDFTSEPEKPSIASRVKGIISGLFGGEKADDAAPGKEEKRSRPPRSGNRSSGRGPRGRSGGGRPSGRGDRGPAGKGGRSGSSRPNNSRRRPRGSGNRKPRNASASSDSKES